MFGQWWKSTHICTPTYISLSLFSNWAIHTRDVLLHPEPHPIPEKDSDDSGTRVEKKNWFHVYFVFQGHEVSMKQVSIFHPVIKMAWLELLHPVWDCSITKSDISGHSLLQLEGAEAEALGDADDTDHKPRVLGAIEDVPPRRSMAPSLFTFIYSSETRPWIVSLSASLLATDNTQHKANEEMRWHKKKERSPLFPWLIRTGWLQLHFCLGISRRFHIEQPLEARKVGEKAPLYLSPLLFISENLVNLEFDSCGAFLSPRQLSSDSGLFFQTDV